jgi:hypothetical protein
MTLSRVFLQPSRQMAEELWQALRTGDGLENATYPEEINFQLAVDQNSIWTGRLRVNETVFFGNDIAGDQTPALPNPIEIVQGLELNGSRQSGDNRFPRNSDVGWQIALQVSC